MLERVTKKMQATVFLTAATVTLALDNVASAGAFECEADHQCDGGYCYLESRKCVQCLDCAHYLRQSSQWRTCARGYHDCGECLAGFEYEYLTDGTTRSFCVPTKESESGLLNARSPYFWIIIASVVGIVSILVFVMLKYYRGFKTRNSLHNSNLDPENPPPPSTETDNETPPPSYDSSIPLLQRYSDVSPALVTSLTVVEKEDSNLQQAVPFTNPDPPYGVGGTLELENEVQDGLQEEFNLPNSPLIESGDENEGPRAISPPQVEDEDTMPSDWVPFPDTREPALSEEPPSEEQSSVTCSLSDVSDNPAADVPSGAQEVLNDSGVSASSSHQSDLSFAHGVDGLEMLGSGQEAGATSLHSVLQRRRSDEDLSILSERKRQRRDSGSSSMKSVEVLRENI